MGGESIGPCCTCCTCCREPCSLLFNIRESVGPCGTCCWEPCYLLINMGESIGPSCTCCTCCREPCSLLFNIRESVGPYFCIFDTRSQLEVKFITPEYLLGCFFSDTRVFLDGTIMYTVFNYDTRGVSDGTFPVIVHYSVGFASCCDY